ncbi:hypothetical protein BCR33DRAFT_710918 [Rhizoclosmatium globosum]|uniref:ER membrane protein complex subunit 10 n=1 Tax=Rhizoclosmatium globosum TaxID=329046 RepID=A0A1Y2D2L8_9FUNG|nr:hypothetical protein BCR33DRAFT_710918 [Rhizoclosmatium globosum]|eukprot:ORY53500.1 hypothetical protein BCR33DRAFT_710918 [Rhizoclosmatium globosum]
MQLPILTLLFASFAVFVSAANHFQVLHAVGDSPFTVRGLITQLEKKTGSTGARYENYEGLDLSPITSAPADESTLYHIKIVQGQLELSSSIRLCHLQKAQLVDMITVHVDQTGVPFHVDYAVESKDGSCGNIKKVAVAAKNGFKTKAVFGKTHDGARPRLDQMTAETVTGKTEEKSFLQKYWYYILPIVVILALTGGEEPKK